MKAVFSSPPNSKNYISLIDSEVVILDQSGVCLTSSSNKLIGKQYDLDQIAKHQAGGTSRVKSLPIINPHENVEFFLLVDQKDLAKYNLNIIRKLSSMLAQKQLQELRTFKGSTDEFISRLIDKVTEENSPMFEQEAKELGIDLKDQYLTIAIRLTDFPQRIEKIDDDFERREEVDKWRKKIQSAINGFFTRKPIAHVFYRPEEGVFIVLKAAEENEEEKMIKMIKKSFSAIFSPLKFNSKDEVIAGIGGCTSGAHNLSRSMKEAELACRIAKKLQKTEGGFTFDEFGIISILADKNSDETSRFAERILERIKNDIMLETLNVFFSCNLSVTETARKLKLHRNTIIYRLNRINELLNLNPRNLEEAISIKTALLIKQIQ